MLHDDESTTSTLRPRWCTDEYGALVEIYWQGKTTIPQDVQIKFDMNCSGTESGYLCGYVDVYHISKHFLFGSVSAYELKNSAL